MQRRKRRLLIVAVSGRALARSARRSDLDVSVLDAFADGDTRTLARRCHAVSLPLNRQEILAWTKRIYSDDERFDVVYGSGAEHAPEVIEALRSRARVLGNHPEVLHVVGRARRLFTLFDELEIPYPEVSFVATTDRFKWLVKSEGGCGGRHVADWPPSRPLNSGQYLQRFVGGPVYSVLFAADGESFRVIGWNRLLRATGEDGSGFSYQGALGQFSPDAGIVRRITKYIESAVSALALRGLNGLDFVLQGDRPLVLDLNVRPPATIALYDDEFPRGLIDVHIEACKGRLATATRHPTRRECSGHAIVYCRRSVQIPVGLLWPKWCTDLPCSGYTIAAGEPVCTVHARGHGPQEEIRRVLETRRIQVRDWMESTAALPHRMPTS